jgi:hypothetical protein
MAALAQTISVIDRSGRVVSTSKHLFGVFKEAKSAYKERKAEIKAGKQAKVAEREARRALAAYTIHDSRSALSSRGDPRRSKSVTRHPEHSRHHRADESARGHRSHRYEQDLHTIASSRHAHERPHTELVRRHTSHDIVATPRYAHPGGRSHSVSHVDMDLAYGEFHPSSLERAKSGPEGNLNGLVAKAKLLLVEADCAHHSVTATIAHLQKHPEAMAAVALTLAEISKVVSKMAPAALAALRTSAPGVFALLASPQFMIAAGVGIGVTVVMFGGYKIIKQIKAANSARRGSMDEMMELSSDLGHIENWRRGVADIEATSVGTSVDGEFITPKAAAMSGILMPERVTGLREPHGVTRAPRELDRPTDTASNSSRGSRQSRTSRSTRRSKAFTEGDGKDKKGKKKKDKQKKPSPLRLLFR